MVSAVDSAKDQPGVSGGTDRGRCSGGCGTADAATAGNADTAAATTASGSGNVSSRSATPQGRRRKRAAAQAKRHTANVFLKHKMKYKKKSSAPEDSGSSSTESDRATPVVAVRAPPVTFLPGAVMGDCCLDDDDELYRPGCVPPQPLPPASRSPGVVANQSTADRLAQAAATLPPPPPLLPPISTLCDPSTASGAAAAAQAAGGMPLSRSDSTYFKCIPSVSSTLSTTSSHSSAASAEKEGSDSSDSLVSAKTTQRRSLKKAAAAAAAATAGAGGSGSGGGGSSSSGVPSCGSAEKEGSSDSSDSPASCVSASRKSIKKLIRNKYDIFRRQKLKYRQLLGKSGSTRSDKHLDYARVSDDAGDADGGTASTLHANVRCQSMGSGPASNGSSSSSSSASSSTSSRLSAEVAAAAAAATGCHTFHLPGPRGLPHNHMLHSSSSSGNQSSSSLQSSSSSRSSRDNGGSAAERGRAERRQPSPAIINRVVPLMVMVQRQTVEGDSSSSALMFKCNMCNMYSNLMRNVLMHISERHATAQYCFDCESFFPDEHSLDSHRTIGCQGGCSVSRAGSDVPTTGEGSESPSSSSSGICLKEGTSSVTSASEAAAATTNVVSTAGSKESHGRAKAADVDSANREVPVGLMPAAAGPARILRPRHPHSAAVAAAAAAIPPTDSANYRRADAARSTCSSASLHSIVNNYESDKGSELTLRSAFSASSASSSVPSSAFSDVSSLASSAGSAASLLPTLAAIREIASEVGKEYRCRLCNKEFLGSCYLKRHMRSHTGEKICFCQICHRGFSEWRNLRNHIARFHNGGLRGRSTSRSSGSDNGPATTMAATTLTSTSGFSESLASSPSIAASRSAVAATTVDTTDASAAGANPGETSDAEDAAVDEVPDMEHVSADSPDSKDNCQIIALDAESDMLQHSTMQLGSTSSRLELNSDETFRKKALTPHDCVGGLRRTYHCEPCNKDFVTKFAMQRHLDFHADKRPFHCDMCSYKSKTKPQLKVHQMRHKGQKVYHCDLCNYDCVTHSDLNRHCKSMSHKSRHRGDVTSPP